MKKPVFTGSGCAIVTPMHPDGSVHYESLGNLIEFLLSHSTDSIIVCGTTGESATLSAEEHHDVISYTVKKVGGRVPVIAGAGSNSTAHAIELSRSAQEAGADALLHVTPYYNKTSQLGLIRHFGAVADSTELPVILYNVPSRTGVNLAPATCKELSKHPKICAIKEASGNLSQIAEIAQLCGEELTIYSGNDDQILPILSLGGKGVISVLANVLPQETHDICALFDEHRFSESLSLQLRLLPLIHALFCDVNPIPVKDALNQMGFDVGTCRLPLDELPKSKKEPLHAELLRLGLIPCRS